MDDNSKGFAEFLLKIGGIVLLVVLGKEGVKVLQGKKFSILKAFASFFCALLVCMLTGVV